jgi:4-hydroxybenzoate polyprenyltransferase
MGCAYNIAPLRTKDIPYLDVISEAINNPLRFCAGWYIVTFTIIPPVSLLIAYWMLGAYFMTLKRFSEYRQIGPEQAGWYRKSFRHYTDKSLLNSTIFYAAAAMLFFGAFIMRYRLELVLSFPVIALLMAVYFNLAFEHDSAVQNPEKLFREPQLMLLFAICVILLVTLLFVRVPILSQMFPRSLAP